MKVYVLFNYIYEDILCVHSKPNKLCENCLKEISSTEKKYIQERTFEVVTKFIDEPLRNKNHKLNKKKP